RGGAVGRHDHDEHDRWARWHDRARPGRRREDLGASAGVDRVARMSPAGPGSLLRLDGVTRRFAPHDPPAVQSPCLTVEPGEILALLGPSGGGKSTTLRLIAGFEIPDRGTIEIRGQRMAGDGKPVPPEARGVGMVFQDYALFPHLTVFDNV